MLDSLTLASSRFGHVFDRELLPVYDLADTCVVLGYKYSNEIFMFGSHPTVDVASCFFILHHCSS